MNAAYCDTSVVVAYYVPEDHSATAERLLESVDRRMISALVLTEASAAFRRKVHDKVLSRSNAQAAFADFRRDVATGIFSIIDIERRHYDHAASQVWATKERLRTLDAVHLAVAELDGLTMLTADEVLAKAAKDLGVTSLWAGSPKA